MSNEYNNKRYYWIKLKDTFFTSDTVDFLMSQKDGANYVVLYQMLCLKTANTNGELSRQIGEIIVPFDIDKIHRDCKYFSVDTIRVALELYKKLGLIYEQENGILQITNFANLIGSESQNAIYKRQQREEGKRLEFVQQMSNKRLDIREKRKEIRDIEGDINSAPAPAHTREECFSAFTPPTLDEVKTFVEARGLDKVDAERFFNWFSASDWYRGRTRVVNWQAEACNWQRRGIEDAKTGGVPGEQNRGRSFGSKIETENTSKNFAEREYTHEQCDSVFTNIADIKGVEL